MDKGTAPSKVRMDTCLYLTPDQVASVKEGSLIQAKVVQQLLGGLSRDAVNKYVKAGLLVRGTYGYYTRESVWRTMRWRMNEWNDGGRQRRTLKSAITDPKVRQAMKREKLDATARVPAGYVDMEEYAKAVGRTALAVYQNARRLRVGTVQLDKKLYVRKLQLDRHLDPVIPAGLITIREWAQGNGISCTRAQKLIRKAGLQEQMKLGVGLRRYYRLKDLMPLVPRKVPAGYGTVWAFVKGDQMRSYRIKRALTNAGVVPLLVHGHYHYYPSRIIRRLAALDARKEALKRKKMNTKARRT